ncbi:uncharacterized protein LOC134182454 [Corticium candelabrum]|uniref:uncharacterized protein LOC134182454 n=1 Tax=Corticium candelabrum TaxID=121492 RepID=UPI002E254651|nr:uncharacterized protein LOC134182454 [Corticium candelabrum]
MATVLGVAVMMCLSLCSVSAYDDCYDYLTETYLECAYCCCEYSNGSRYCCSCSTLAWWAWLVIVIGVVLVFGILIAVGVWRRRVYMRQHTIITMVRAPAPAFVHSFSQSNTIPYVKL